MLWYCLLLLLWNARWAIAGKKFFPVRPLPYNYKALEPYVSRTTVEEHHNLHYYRSVKTLNRMVLSIGRLHNSTLEEIMIDSYEWNKPMYQMAAESWNHDFYFKCMTLYYLPPSKFLREQIERDFRSFARFTMDLRKAGNSVYGSGWAWVVYDIVEQALRIITTTGADNPMTMNKFLRPILAMDMWEHAYLRDFESKRDYTETFVNALVDWKFVEETLSKVKREAAEAGEELERTRQERAIERECRKNEIEQIERWVERIAADAEQVERVRIEAEMVMETAKQDEKWLEDLAALSGRASSELKLEMKIDEIHSHVKGSVDQKILEKGFGRDVSSTGPEGHQLSVAAPDFLGTLTRLEEWERNAAGVNLTLENAVVNTTHVGRVEEADTESTAGIKKQRQVGLLTLFSRTRDGNGSGSALDSTSQLVRKPWIAVGYLWNVLSSRMTRTPDVASNDASSISSAESSKVLDGKMNVADDPGEGPSTAETPEKEEIVGKANGPSNLLVKLLSFIWNIIRSFFRFLYFVWSLG
jgi:superoxide dismutase, Fe-Mn family